MKIQDIILAAGNGSYFYDDQAAIASGALNDGFFYLGAPITSGFEKIRQPAVSLSIGLVLNDDHIAWGDMMSVQYSGAGGRDRLFNQRSITGIIDKHVRPRLVGMSIEGSISSCCDAAFFQVNDARLPVAIEYGVSQALLAAKAHSSAVTMAEVICADFGLLLPTRPVPIFSQSGDDRYSNIDKMILKSVSIMPHGLINSQEKFGQSGDTFLEYVKWVVQRIGEIGSQGYRPILHFDIYGNAGRSFDLDPLAIADFLATAGDSAGEFELNIECPADFGSREGQIEGYIAILDALKRKGSPVRIVADERCNTLADIETFAKNHAAHILQIKMPDVGSVIDTARAVLLCKQNGVGAYVGGSCAETDLSARASVHVAVATQADMMLAKPGMGVDEGISIVGNEQNRLLATLNRRANQSITVSSQ